MNLLSRYIKEDFASYEDFKANFRIDVPERFNFAYDIVDEYARLEPDKTALVWCDDNGGERVFTFADISKLSNQAANFFQNHGIKKGDAVMLVLKRRWHYWAASMALCKLGAIMIPGTYLLTAKDLKYRLESAQTKMIVSIADKEVVEAIEGAKVDVIRASVDGPVPGFIDFTAEIAKCSETFEKPSDLPDNDDPMLLYFTSGTTGMPKMVQQSFTYPLGHIVTARFWHNTGEDDLHITVADTGWAKCSWGKIYGQWIAGTAQFVYDMDSFVPEKLAEKLAKYRVTSFCAPPTVYRFLIKEDLSAYDLSALKHASTAGEPLNPEVYNQFKRQFGIGIREAFGQSESTPILGNFIFSPPRPGSIGKPNPMYKVLLLDERGKPAEVGEEGEIVIDTSNGKPVGLFDGYYMAKERTDACWYGDKYHTGDMAWMDEDGYFWFIGRGDDVIKSSGYRIGPFEVESALMEHPAVLECAISAAPDPTRGQVVKASVILARGYEPSDKLTKDLQNHVKRVTAPYKYPRIIEFVKELPKTVSGKIKRVQLREAAMESAKAFI